MRCAPATRREHHIGSSFGKPQGCSASKAATSTDATPRFMGGRVGAKCMAPISRLEAMSQTVRGVISRKKGEPVELVDIVVPDPGPGEALVDVIACGVCHTDLTYRDGGINDEYPFLLGHEAAGTVEAVGPGVTSVAPGDFVILNWRAVCGQCRACKRGRPHLCFDTFNAEQKMTLTDGTELTPALGIGAFADKTLVAAGQCTKVNPKADPAVAGLLGCVSRTGRSFWARSSSKPPRSSWAPCSSRTANRP